MHFSTYFFKLSEKFFIGEASLTDKQLEIIQELAKLPELTEQLTIDIFNQFEFYSSLKDTTRLKKLYTSDSVANYITALSKNQTLRYATNTEIEIVKHKINILKTHPFTKDMFDDNNYELIYQAKVVSDVLNAKCMFDLLVIDHMHGIILPVDFKFVEDKARNFMRSFERFNYYIQDTMYTDILNTEIINLGLNYEVLQFQFVVVSQLDDVILTFIPEIDYIPEQNIILVNNKVKKPWKYYFDKIKWHLTYQVFDYTQEEYESRGVIEIPSTNNTNFFSNKNNYGESNKNDCLKYDLPF